MGQIFSIGKGLFYIRPTKKHIEFIGLIKILIDYYSPEGELD